VKDAVTLLTDLGDSARAIAGGYSLILMMKFASRRPIT
jgi:CO/xanthine dehydrogenase FAD-binding subunit